MSNIYKAFEKGKALIAFITCGDPDFDTTAAVVREAVKNGADLIELGIPFSDPTAEGPVIQGANLRALRGGATTDRIFEFVKELRRDVKVPFVFMTYANVIFSYGAERFISTCNHIGIDGLIVPDLPFEEKEEFQPICSHYGVDLISMIAPTSTNRVGMISKEAEGFLYLTVGAGIQDDGNEGVAALSSVVDAVKRNTKVPCCVEGDPSAAGQSVQIPDTCDGIILVSALVEIVEKYAKDAPQYVGEYVKRVRAALR